MADDLRIRRLLHGHQIVERNHFPGVRAHVILPDVLCLRAEFAVGLHIHAIRPVVEIEIVYIYRAHVGLQRVRDLGQRNLQTLGFLAVDANQVLRIVCRETGEKPGHLLAGISLRDQFVRIVRDGLQRIAAKIFELELKSTKLPQSKYRRWIERHHHRSLHSHHRSAQSLNDCCGRVLRSFAFSKPFRLAKTIARLGALPAKLNPMTLNTP